MPKLPRISSAKNLSEFERAPRRSLERQIVGKHVPDTQAIVAAAERSAESTDALVRSIAAAQRERQRGIQQLADDAGGENELVRDRYDRVGAERGREEVGRGAGQRGQRIVRRRAPERGKAFVQRDAEPGPRSER